MARVKHDWYVVYNRQNIYGCLFIENSDEEKKTAAFIKMLQKMIARHYEIPTNEVTIVNLIKLEK